MPWSEEAIPDEDDLYRRLAPHHVKKRDGTVGSVAFKRRSDEGSGPLEPDPDISVDWARYTTPEGSLMLAERPAHGIGALPAGFPRNELPLKLTVTNTPDEMRNNRAHSSIRGNVGDLAEENCYLMARKLTERILKLPERILG
jgi:hypothetical protein